LAEKEAQPSKKDKKKI